MVKGKSHQTFKGTLLLFLFMILTYPSDAFAYLDPGSGSYVIQILVGVFFGALYIIKSYWNRLKLFFSGLFSKKTKNKDIT